MPEFAYQEPFPLGPDPTRLNSAQKICAAVRVGLSIDYRVLRTFLWVKTAHVRSLI
jgi:hypothetical protein